MSKDRAPIPPEIAARVLFLHDRTCCVCRQRGKPVQIHHIDGDPSNSAPVNLAVLCFDCHRETQIRGGFDRKLDGDQVVLYRDDWVRVVARDRAEQQASRDTLKAESAEKLELVTSIAEIFREREEYELLAMHYASIDNTELRDKYVELALTKPASDQTICYLRGLQGRPDLIPHDVIDREEARYDANQDWTQKARFLIKLGRYFEAAAAYVRGIDESLEGHGVFSAAYYLKELAESGLTERLFEIAYTEAKNEGDLWWQVRALEEL